LIKSNTLDLARSCHTTLTLIYWHLPDSRLTPTNLIFFFLSVTFVQTTLCKLSPLTRHENAENNEATFDSSRLRLVSLSASPQPRPESKR
jgi:hypothetical protein